MMTNEADPRPTTFVYVDGFNLYYGGLRRSPYKWLDLRALLERVMKKNKIERILYFTALVKPRREDPRQDVCQQVYIRALETLPGLEVEYGNFQSEKRLMIRADGYGTLAMRWSKEKGSDVNLATRLMDDFHRGRFEAAAVVSNDSDLASPIRTINDSATRPVGIVTPPRWKDQPSSELSQVTAFRYRITDKAMREGQFPTTVTDSDGNRIHKPEEW